MKRSRLLDRFRSPQKHRSARPSRPVCGNTLETMLEELESRRVLAVSFQGVSHDFNTTPTDVRYYYEVSVTKSGPADAGELWMRYNAQYNRVDFDTNSGFTNTTNFPLLTPVEFKPTPVAAPFSVPGINTIVGATWNGVTQNFHSASVIITGTAGTSVHLANGDPLPLGLSITLSASVASPSAVFLDGPVDNTLNNAWATGVSMSANSITTSAPLTALSAVGSGVSMRARDGIQLRNTMNTGQLTARISDGDFQIIAGATLNGSLGVFTGQKGSGVGFGGVGGDILIDGTVNGSSVTLQTNSDVQATTIATGPSGILSGGGSLTLFNAGLDGGEIDVRTRNFAVTNVDVGVPSTTNPIPDIGISIEQLAGDLKVAAVPSSRGQISLKASGANAAIQVNSDINTEAGLALDASNLVVSSPLTTAAGNIRLSGDTVQIGGFVTAGKSGVGNVAITSRKGAISVLSAAVVQAPGEQITIQAATDVTSQAQLTAEQLIVTAGGAITIASNANELTATASKGVTVTDTNDLIVRSATTQSGPISITTGGLLSVNTAVLQGTGTAALDGAAGVLLENLRVQNGSATVSSSGGTVRVNGTVALPGDQADLTVTATAGNVVIDSSASVSVNDQLALSAPLGRVLTPGTVTAVRVDTSGAGYTSSPTVTLDAGVNGAASAAIANQGVAGFRVTSGGSGYVTPPTVNIIGGGGANAKATAFLAADGSVSRIVVTNPGTGYTSAPTVTFSGGSGSGAVAEALINGVSAVIVSNPGSGYLVPPEITISSGAGGVASPITVNDAGAIQSIQVSVGGSDYGVAPTVSILDSSNSGFGASATANLASGVSIYTVTNPGSGYTAAPTVSFTNAPGDSSPGGATAIAQISGQVSAINFNPLTDGGTNYSPGVKVGFVGDGSGATAAATIDGSVTNTTLGAGGTGTSGTGYSTVPTVTFSAPDKAGGVLATATAFLGLTTASVGINYTAIPGGPTTLTTWLVAPTITFKAPPGGVAATGLLQLDANGVISGLSVTNAGWGYTTLTNADFTITGGVRKTTAVTLDPTFTANSSSFTVSRLQVTNAGTGYQNNPSITFSAGNAAATADVRGAVDSVTLLAGGIGYTAPPLINFVDGSGTGATATTSIRAKVIGLSITSPGVYKAAPSVTFTPVAGDITGTGAAATVGISNYVSSITVNNAGSGYDPATTTVSLKPVAGGGGAVCGAIAVNATGAVTGINVGYGGQDYVAPPTVTINDTSGSGSGATATAILTAGKITGFTIVNAGKGYNPATTIVTLASAGSGATAVANLDATGAITSVTVTSSGSGYNPSAPPTVRITPYGRTATGTAAIGPGQVTGIRVDAGGNGYATAPTVTISGNGTGATAIANVVGGVVTGVVVTNPGSGYTGAVTVAISGGGGSGAAATALVGGVSTATVPITNNANYANYAALPRVTFSGGGAATQATGTAIISNIAQLNAKRLSWTAIEAPLDAVTSSFNRLSVNLTGVNLAGNGDLVLRSTSALTLDGVSTVDGSISIAAPSLTVNGDVVVGDSSSKRNRTIDLSASSGNLTINSNVGTLLPGAINRTPLAQSISLTALQGSITAAAPALLTTNDIVFTASKSTTLQTSAKTVTGSVSDSSAGITILQSANDPSGNPLPLDVKFLTAAGGPIRVDTSAAPLTVGRINAGDVGSITLAGSSITQDTTDPDSDLVAAAVMLTARTGGIDVDTSTASLTASAPLSNIRVTNVPADSSTVLPVLTVVAASALNDVTISSAAGIVATSVTSTGGRNISLTASGATGDVKLGSVTSTKGVVTIVSGRDIMAVDPVATTPVIVTGNARITAAGKVTLRTTVDSIAGTAGGDIAVNESSDISVGEPQNPSFQSLLSSGGNVAVTAAGTISASNVQATAPMTGITLTSTAAAVQVGTAVGSSVKVNAKGDVTELPGGIIATPALTVTSSGAQVNLGTNANQIGTVDVANGTGTVTIRDVDADLKLGGITGGKVTIVSGGGGGVTQLANTAVKASSRLTVTSTDGGVTLTNTGNDAASLSIVAAGQTVAYTDATGFDVAGSGIAAANVTLTAAGGVTQTAGITAGSLAINGNGSSIVLNTVPNDVSTFSATNVGGYVAFVDVAGGLTLGGINAASVALTSIGPLTQSAPITAQSLQINGGGSTPITLDTQANSIGLFRAVYAGPVAVKDTVGDLLLAGIEGTTVSVTAAGTVYQSLPIKATSLSVVGNGGSIALDSQPNVIGSFAATNGPGSVAVWSTANGLTLTGVSGGAVAVTAAGTVTQTAPITAASLAFNGNGGPIVLDTQSNVIGSFASYNGSGAISIRDTVGDLVLAGVTGGAISVTAAGALTQSAAITATSLTISNNGPTVRLDNPANAVGSFTGSNSGGDVSLVTAGSFSVGPVTAGTAGAGNGNLSLTSVTGSIAVVGNLTALQDQITLDARQGTITFAPGVGLYGDILVYYFDPQQPAPVLPGTVPAIVATNGDLAISNPAADNTVLLNGYSATGNISIVSNTGFQVAGKLRTTGVNKTVQLIAYSGSIGFVGNGGIDNAPSLGGNTSITANGGTVTGVSGTTISGGATSISSGQAISIPGSIAADTLGVYANGNTIALGGANRIGTLTAANGTGDVTVTDTSGNLVLANVSGTNVVVTAAGAVTESAPITAATLVVTGAGSPIALDSQPNAIGSFAATNGSGSVALWNTAASLTLAGVTGGVFAVTAAGPVTQTAPITASSLVFHGNGGPLALDSQPNVIRSFAATNGSGSVAVWSTANGLTLAGVSGGTVALTAAGPVTQTAPITASSLNFNGNGGPMTLDSQPNAIGSFASHNGSGTISIKDTVGDLVLAGVVGGTVTVTAAGAVTQSAPITATSLVVTGVGSPITLTAANVLDSFSAANGAGAVAVQDTLDGLTLGNITSGSLSVAAAGAVTVNQTRVVASGPATITTKNGGGFTVTGPQPGGLVSSGGQLNLAGVQGQIALVNGGLVSGSPITGNGKTIQVGGTVTTVAALNSAVSQVNGLPTIAGSPYEILVGANIALSQTLSFSRPVSLRGTSNAVTLTGSTAVTNGVVLGATATGSRITSLAFSGFGGTAIQLNSVTGAAVSGVRVTGINGTTTGIGFAGTSTGTTLRGSQFINCGNAISIVGATGLTVGGTAAGQPNSVTSAAKAGVFASGICTGSSVIKTSFVTTAQPYNVGGARGLTIVR